MSITGYGNQWVCDLVPYEPGKPIEETARELGLGPDEIVKLAQEKAEQIILKSEEKANEMKYASIQYADEILDKLEKDTADIIGTLKMNREELKSMK